MCATLMGNDLMNLLCGYGGRTAMITTVSHDSGQGCGVVKKGNPIIATISIKSVGSS